ncbi:uncharacterized protein LOC141586916 [Silene latifolia]|uniref:uncharacterized protein LOC141586916 n=1 Tax=Silene latifolia TaxID=37657 RepID=UPI003D77831A
MLVLKKWHPTFGLELDALSVVPVWVLLLDLDPVFWSSTALSKIASKLGKPLYADPVTTHKGRLGFARVLIELDVSKPVPDHLLLHSPFGGTLLQKIEVELMPYFCSHCKKLGHEHKQCRLLHKKKDKTVVSAPKTYAAVLKSSDQQVVAETAPVSVTEQPEYGGTETSKGSHDQHLAQVMTQAPLVVSPRALHSPQHNGMVNPVGSPAQHPTQDMNGSSRTDLRPVVGDKFGGPLIHDSSLLLHQGASGNDIIDKITPNPEMQDIPVRLTIAPRVHSLDIQDLKGNDDPPPLPFP